MNQKKQLTFFAWTDTHFGYEQKFADYDHRYKAVQQMTRLEGYPFPAEIGGRIENPDFIMHCGDFVTAEKDGQQVLAYYLHTIQQTNLPSFETLGNHETGYADVVAYFEKKHGGRYYSFRRKGLCFLSLYQTFDRSEQVEALDNQQLQWLNRELVGIGPNEPVVLFAHDRPDNLPNADEVDSVLGQANVILMLSGHKHGVGVNSGASPYRWNGRNGIMLGHCRDHPIDPAYARTFVVVRITENEIAVVPWRWDLAEWARRQGWEDEQGEHVIIDRGVES